MLKYGASSVPVTVRSDPTLATEAAGYALTAPALAVIAPEIIERLHMRTEPVYQIRSSPAVVEIGPVLGMLLGNRNHWYNNTWLSREPQRATAVYPRIGGLLCAFSCRNVSAIDDCAYGLYYAPGDQRWRYGAIPLPAVTHRRSFHMEPAVISRLQAATGMRIFNSRRLDKWELYSLLQADPTFRSYLPETIRVTEAAAVLSLLRNHGAVVLKPVDLSRGRGILFVSGAAEPYRLVDSRADRERHESLLSEAELSALIAAEIVGHRYLCQQRVELAHIDGAPFDIRAVMQRDARGSWQCTGIECRLAGHGSLITNIASGGRAVTLPEAIGAAFGDTSDSLAAETRVVAVCRHLCAILDATGESYGELGIDVAFDQTGKAWLIEANVLPTFKGFLQLDQATYQRLLAAPLLYAGYLAGFGEEQGGGNHPH